MQSYSTKAFVSVPYASSHLTWPMEAMAGKSSKSRFISELDYSFYLLVLGFSSALLDRLQETSVDVMTLRREATFVANPGMLEGEISLFGLSFSVEKLRHFS